MRIPIPPSARSRVAVSLLVIAGSAFAGCADDSTAPPTNQEANAATPPVINEHRLAPNGHAILGPSGQRMPIDPKTVTGFVDAATLNGKYLDLNGWIALADLSAPADNAVAIAGKKSVAVTPTIERPDVVDGYDQEGLLRTGYGMSIPVSALDCSAPDQGLKTYAVARGAAAPLEWLGNVKEIVRDACRGR